MQKDVKCNRLTYYYFIYYSYLYFFLHTPIVHCDRYIKRNALVATKNLGQPALVALSHDAADDNDDGGLPHAHREPHTIMPAGD